MMFGNTSQSGKAIHSHEFFTENSCKEAIVKLNNSLPKFKGNDDKYYFATNGFVFMDCVKK